MMTNLPSIAQLCDLYEEYRVNLFDNAVPAIEMVRIEWSNQLRKVAGNCRKKTRHIKLSTYYHSNHPELIGPTLVHEMIHLLIANHGTKFYKWLEYIQKVKGFPVARYAVDRATEKVYRWLYTCQNCGKQHKKGKRLHLGGMNHRCLCNKQLGKLSEKQLTKIC